jgi:histidine kinase-like protein
VASGAAPSATGISVSVARDPALVRTVRLVTAAFARRASLGEDLVEEVRLAIGEACALLVGTESARSAGAGPAEGPVEVDLEVTDRLYAVVSAPDQVLPATDPATIDGGGVEPLTLLRGMVEDLKVEESATGTTLTMSWPLS